jgi:UDP-glucuronate decarboxylase
MTAFLLKSDIEEIVSSLGDAAHEFEGKTVLLTGGCGFLGRYFTEVFVHLNQYLLKEPMQLVSLDNLITGGCDKTNISKMPNVRFVEHNAIEQFTWSSRLHYVIHTAGIASPFYYRAYPLETLEVATIGTKNMLKLATEHGARFVFFSSSEIYGDPDSKHVPTPESYRGNISCQGPRACYDESKRLGETLCYIFHTKHGTQANAIRPFNVFGPGMQESDYRVLPNFASRIKGGLPLNVYASGKQTRTFCYVTDAIVGFLLVVLRGVPGEAYNIGNPDPEISMLELVQRLETVLGRKLDFNMIEYPDSYPADEPQRRRPDIRKARLQLGYEPIVDLDEGLRRFLSWTNATYQGRL